MTTYDITTTTIDTNLLEDGDIINCPYSGAVKSITLPKGTYTLECWGAQGGYRSSTTYGGKGGYSKGTLTLTEACTVYLRAGGSGNSGGVSGGFNGGGRRATYAGGGGASDIRLGTDSLYARVIVAGGGGSDGRATYAGGAGGGTSGATVSSGYGTNNGPGTATYSGSSTSTTATSQSTSTSSSSDIKGGFGFGGNGVYQSSGYGGAGGGGWYGGSGTYPDGSSDDDKGGAGGSGYVYTSGTASQYPSGCLLIASDYLTSASTTVGTSSFTSPTGSTETGHSGNGYARITIVEVLNKAQWVADGVVVEKTALTEFPVTNPPDVSKQYYRYDWTVDGEIIDTATYVPTEPVTIVASYYLWAVTWMADGSVKRMDDLDDWPTVPPDVSKKYYRYDWTLDGVIVDPPTLTLTEPTVFIAQYADNAFVWTDAGVVLRKDDVADWPTDPPSTYQAGYQSVWTVDGDPVDLSEFIPVNGTVLAVVRYEWVIPHLMVKVWDGDPQEYFKWIDMARIEYNLNILAVGAGTANVSYDQPTRAKQFDWREAQKVENHLATLAEAVTVNLDTPIEDAWGELRTVSYVDFERWEADFWQIYTAMGGTGERIPAGTIITTYSLVAYADKWLGTGPYYQYQDAPGVHEDIEAVAYISHTATDAQVMSAYNAVLKAEAVGARLIRIRAIGLKPTVDIPMKITIGGFRLYQEVVLSVAGWIGSGPWTQTVTMPKEVANAVLGVWEGMSDDAVESMTNAILSVSAISGTQVTIRCLGDKPDIALNPVIMWEEDSQ